MTLSFEQAHQYHVELWDIILKNLDEQVWKDERFMVFETLKRKSLDTLLETKNQAAQGPKIWNSCFACHYMMQNNCTDCRRCPIDWPNYAPACEAPVSLFRNLVKGFQWRFTPSSIFYITLQEARDIVQTIRDLP